MPLSRRLTPDYRERLAQQAETPAPTGSAWEQFIAKVGSTRDGTPYVNLGGVGSEGKVYVPENGSFRVGQTDPGNGRAWTYSGDTFTPSPLPAASPPSGNSQRDIYATLGNWAMGQMGQTPTSSQTPTSVSEVPNPTREEFMTESSPSNWDKLGKIVSTPGGIFNPGSYEGDLELTDEGASAYLQARMDRVTQIAKLSGASDDELATLQQQMIYDLQQAPRTGQDGKDLSTDEWVTSAEGLINSYETPYAQSAITDTPTSGQGQEYIYDPKEIAGLQAWATGLMKPYVDKLAASGQSELAAAYQQQATLAPLWQAVQDREALARQLQAAQNQLASQQSGSTGLTPEDIAAALGGG